MHIVILSDFETQSGGAAICATRLVDALINSGQQVTRIVSYPDGQKHPWNTITLAPSFSTWGALRGLPSYLSEPYAGREHSRKLSRLLDVLKPDIINVHNLHGALKNGWSLRLLADCQRYAPVVWTLHDMWSFTGRCAFSYDCEKYLAGCDAACPTPGEYPALPPEKIAPAWGQRARLFKESHRLAAVAPSAWLAGRAQQGLWKGHRIETIPYGVPLDIYSPVEKDIARRALGLDVTGPAILLAGVSLEDHRKGVHYAVEAISKVSQRPLSVITFGANPPQIELPGVSTHHLGYIDHERTKALAYNAADLYLHSALADNLPNMVMESIACGTPVMAFSVGGLPELVVPGKTGWLVRDISVEQLAAGLELALAELDRGEFGDDICRQVAEQDYSPQLQAQRYLDLFNDLA